MARVTREAILAEIRSLERQKAACPDQAREIDEQITHLCDRLKTIRPFAPRKGII